MPRALPIVALLALLAPAAPAGAGKLDEAREATAGDEGDADGDGDGDEGGDEAAGELGAQVAESFFGALFEGLGEAVAQRAAGVGFAPYPYADGAPGWIFTDIVDDLDAPAPAEPAEEAGPPAEIPLADGESALAAAAPAADELRPAAFGFALEYAYDWGGVHRPAAALALDSASGFGARAELTSYAERLPDGALDYLAIGTAYLALRVADARRIAPYAALGWRYLVDGDAFRNGFTCLLAADLFPARPIVVSALAEGGNLGAAGFFRGRIALGALVFGLEIYAGYDGVVLLGAAERVVFHGPVAGIRGWL